jgi:hypothetical protein
MQLNLDGNQAGHAWHISYSNRSEYGKVNVQELLHSTDVSTSGVKVTVVV